MENSNSSYQLDKATTIEGYFINHHLTEEASQELFIKTCYPYQYDEQGNILYGEDNKPLHDEANPFPALAVFTGVEDNGKKLYDFFSLSKQMTEKGHVLNMEFLVAHIDDLKILEPKYCNGAKYGTAFLGAEKLTLAGLRRKAAGE